MPGRRPPPLVQPATKLDAQAETAIDTLVALMQDTSVAAAVRVAAAAELLRYATGKKPR